MIAEYKVAQGVLPPGLVHRPLSAIASIICLAFIGSVDEANTWAAASMALSFVAFPFAAGFVLAFFAGAALRAFAVLVPFRAAGFLGAFFVDMVLLLGMGFDGMAAIIKPAEPPADNANPTAGVSAYRPSSSIKRWCSSTPNISVSVSANHSTST